MGRENPSTPANDFKPASIACIVLVLICLGVIWYQSGQEPRHTDREADRATSSPHEDSIGPELHSEAHHSSVRVPHEDEPSLPEFDHEPHDNGGTVSTPVSDSEHSAHPVEKSLLIRDQTIRGLDGRVVFKGTIDLKPTLDRIQQGRANHHRNDGTTFQNRERRLPHQPGGYYREYVHPTPGETGPGPQRIIIGRDGDIWYTPDHYKTFQEIKPTSATDGDAN